MAERKVRFIEVQDVVGVTSSIRAVVGPLEVSQPSEEVPEDRYEQSAWWLVKRALLEVVRRWVWESLLLFRTRGFEDMNGQTETPGSRASPVAACPD